YVELDLNDIHYAVSYKTFESILKRCRPYVRSLVLPRLYLDLAKMLAILVEKETPKLISLDDLYVNVNTYIDLSPASVRALRNLTNLEKLFNIHSNCSEDDMKELVESLVNLKKFYYKGDECEFLRYINWQKMERLSVTLEARGANFN